MIKSINLWIKEWRWLLIILAIAALAGAAFLIGSNLGGASSVGSVGIFSALIDIVKIPFVLVFVFLSLRLRDRIAGINWKREKANLFGTPLSSAIYFASWVIGISLIVAFL